MENLQTFELKTADYIFGGDLDPTYVGANGDFYDTERKVYVFLL